MQKIIASVAVLFAATVAHAQTSTTNCVNSGYGVQCTSRTQPSPDQKEEQSQRNLDRAFESIGATIAAKRQRRREEKAQSEVDEQIRLALLTEQPALPPPTDESPSRLVCTINAQPLSIALYEKHGRTDVTSAGVTRTRVATFKPDSVSWTSPVVRSELSRLDGSYVGYSNITALEGQVVWTGKCTLAEQKF